MIMYLSVVFGALLKIVLVAIETLYAGMVLMKYHSDGPHYRLNLDYRDPARSAQHLAVWLGVKVLEVGIRVVMVLFTMLTEASAEVAEWAMDLSPTVRK